MIGTILGLNFVNVIRMFSTFIANMFFVYGRLFSMNTQMWEGHPAGQ